MSAARGHAPPRPDAPPDGWEPAAAQRAPRRWWLAIGLVLVVLVASLSGGEATVSPVDEPDGLSVERGGDADLPSAPGGVAPRDWDPPAPGSWAALPPAPIGFRIGHVVADLGGQVIVWGGWQQGRPLRNGALLDATTGRWTPVPASPSTQRRHVPVAAGRTLLLLDEQQSQAFSADDGRWSRLPPPPLPPDTRLTTVATWTGRVAVIATATSDGTAGPLLALDPRRRSWQRVAAPPGRMDDDMAMVWDGRDLLRLGDGGAGFAHRLRLLGGASPPPGGAWQAVAAPELPPDVLATAGVAAVSAGALDGDPVYVWLAPRAEGPDTGAHLVAYRRSGAAEPTTGADATTGDDAAGPWAVLPDPPRGLRDPELVVVGEDVLALDPLGVVRYRRGTERIDDLPLPPGIAPMQQRDAASSRGTVVWWGGGAADGAVWRPQAAAQDPGVDAAPGAAAWVLAGRTDR